MGGLGVSRGWQKDKSIERGRDLCGDPGGERRVGRVGEKGWAGEDDYEDGDGHGDGRR